MNANAPTTPNDSGRDRVWPRRRPVFSLLAVIMAALAAAVTFALLYRTRWSAIRQSLSVSRSR